MTVAEMEAIVGGYHGDPFKVLGPHRVQRSRATPRWEVRAFLPHAETAEVVLADQRVPMTKKHAQGLFVAQIAGEPRLYRIWATLFGGASMDFEDPYRFPPLLSAFDLHLHGEGTHYETYNTLGSHLVEIEGVPSLKEYARVSELLVAASGVRNVQLAEAAGPRATFAVVTRSGIDGLQSALLATAHLERIDPKAGGTIAFRYRP